VTSHDRHLSDKARAVGLVATDRRVGPLPADHGLRGHAVPALTAPAGNEMIAAGRTCACAQGSSMVVRREVGGGFGVSGDDAASLAVMSGGSACSSWSGSGPALAASP
jgi:hypothetical protein